MGKCGVKWAACGHGGRKFADLPQRRGMGAVVRTWLLSVLWLYAGAAAAQEVDVSGASPIRCLRAAHYSSVVWEGALLKENDLSLLKTMGNEERDCRRSFRWEVLEQFPNVDEYHRQVRFSRDIVQERRGETFKLSPASCLVAAFLDDQKSRQLRPSCEEVGYWTKFSAPENDQQIKHRERFRAALIDEVRKAGWQP